MQVITDFGEVYRAGVEAEIDNAAIYDRLLAGSSRPNVIEVYRNLQRASQQNHPPAFRRGADVDAVMDRPGGTGNERTGADRRRHHCPSTARPRPCPVRAGRPRGRLTTATRPHTTNTARSVT